MKQQISIRRDQTRFDPDAISREIIKDKGFWLMQWMHVHLYRALGHRVFNWDVLKSRFHVINFDTSYRDDGDDTSSTTTTIRRENSDEKADVPASPTIEPKKPEKLFDESDVNSIKAMEAEDWLRKTEGLHEPTEAHAVSVEPSSTKENPKEDDDIIRTIMRERPYQWVN